MSAIFFVVFLLLALYAIVSVITVIIDFKTGRYKRFIVLRNNMDDARTILESRRNRGDKVWESIPSE